MKMTETLMVVERERERERERATLYLTWKLSTQPYTGNYLINIKEYIT